MKSRTGILILFAIIVSGCGTMVVQPMQRYNLNDVDPDLKEHLVKEEIKEPGRACGKFIDNRSGCFSIYKKSDGLELIYEDPKMRSESIKKLSLTDNFVYLKKESLREVRSSQALPEALSYKFDAPKDVLLFNYFEKSTAAIFWYNNKFEEVFISD